MDDKTICLHCTLKDCNESDDYCKFRIIKPSPQKKYYLKKRGDPEFKRKHYQRNKKWRATKEGRCVYNAAARRYYKKRRDEQWTPS